ncbi:MAG: anti-sigma factor, partial [Deltaproteobacteria bacterium]
MSDSPMELDDDKSQAAEYALGLLTPGDRSLFEARLLVDSELRDEVIFWQERFVTLAEDMASVKPPVRVKTTIERRLFGVPVKTAGTSILRFLRGGAIAAALLVAMIYFWPQPIEADFRAAMANPDRGLRIEAAYQIASNELIIERVAGQPAAGRDIELWFIAPGAAPVSLGVLSASGETKIIVPAAIASQLAGASLAISDEPIGGS